MISALPSRIRARGTNPEPDVILGGLRAIAPNNASWPFATDTCPTRSLRETTGAGKHEVNSDQLGWVTVWR